MRKKKKINLLTIIGLLLIISGSSILIADYLNTKHRDNAVEQLKQDFLQGIENPSESDDDPDFEDNTYGILEIDSIDVSLPVSDDGNFDRLYHTLVAYSEAPKPPNAGNFSIAGHNGSCGELCKFRDLHSVQNGEEIRFIDRENTYIYEVYRNFEVDMSEVWVLNPIEDETTLTLITCKFPSWTRPERIIVHARLKEVIPN